MKYSSKKAQIIAISIIASWMFLLGYALTQNIQNALVQAGFVLGITFLSVGLFITAHDSMHGLISKDRRINDFYGKIALYLYAAFSFKKMKPKHMEHHQHPASKNDPDYTDFEEESFLPWLWSFIRRYYHLREFILMHGHVLFLMWVSNWNYPKVLLYYALPSILSAIQLFYFGTYLPHRKLNGHTNIHNARSNEFPTWLSFLTCYHFGYHYEHHAFPDTPWWALPHKRPEKVGYA